MSNVLILALPGAENLATTLAKFLGCASAVLFSHTFPDGETLVRIDAPLEGRCVVFAGDLHPPDAKTLPLLFAADAAHELGASQVGLVAPYLPYMRQDKRFHEGEAITSRSYARLLSASLDFLVTVDPHLHRWHSLYEIYTLRARVVSAAPAIASWLQREVASPLLIGPDAESAQWVEQVAHLCNAPWTVMSKTRRGDRDVSVRLRDAGPWPGRTPVLLDDIISTGRTLLAAAAALREAGLPPPLCIGVHALFDADTQARLLAGGMRRVVSCDTVPHPSNAIQLGRLLADALREMTSP